MDEARGRQRARSRRARAARRRRRRRAASSPRPGRPRRRPAGTGAPVAIRTARPAPDARRRAPPGGDVADDLEPDRRVLRRAGDVGRPDRVAVHRGVVPGRQRGRADRPARRGRGRAPPRGRRPPAPSDPGRRRAPRPGPPRPSSSRDPGPSRGPRSQRHPRQVGPGPECDRVDRRVSTPRSRPLEHRQPVELATSGAVRGRRSAVRPARASAPSAGPTMTSDVRVVGQSRRGTAAELAPPRRCRPARRRGAPAAPGPSVPSSTCWPNVSSVSWGEIVSISASIASLDEDAAISPSRTTQRSTDREDAARNQPIRPSMIPSGIPAPSRRAGSPRARPRRAASRLPGRPSPPAARPAAGRRVRAQPIARTTRPPSSGYAGTRLTPARTRLSVPTITSTSATIPTASLALRTVEERQPRRGSGRSRGSSSGPARAIAASARGVSARTSTTAGEPMKWTEIGVDLHPEATLDEGVGELVGDDGEHEHERRRNADRPGELRAGDARRRSAGSVASWLPTVAVMIATMKTHERWSRISIPNRRAIGTPFTRPPPTGRARPVAPARLVPRPSARPRAGPTTADERDEQRDRDDHDPDHRSSSRPRTLNGNSWTSRSVAGSNRYVPPAKNSSVEQLERRSNAKTRSRRRRRPRRS